MKSGALVGLSLFVLTTVKRLWWATKNASGKPANDRSTRTRSPSANQNVT